MQRAPATSPGADSWWRKSSRTSCPARASPTQIHTRLAVAPATLALGERQQGRSRQWRGREHGRGAILTLCAAEAWRVATNRRWISGDQHRRTFLCCACYCAAAPPSVTVLLVALRAAGQAVRWPSPPRRPVISPTSGCRSGEVVAGDAGRWGGTPPAWGRGTRGRERLAVGAMR